MFTAVLTVVDLSEVIVSSMLKQTLAVISINDLPVCIPQALPTAGLRDMSSSLIFESKLTRDI